MSTRDNPSAPIDPADRPRGVVASLVYVFERVMPDPFVLSIGLTFIVSLMAVAFAPHGSVPVVLASWYSARSTSSRSRCR